jgi:hypothetical protein
VNDEHHPTSRHRQDPDVALRGALERELDAELDAVLEKYDGGLTCEDVTTAAQIPLLDDLELFRLGYLPPNHPAHTACAAAVEAGWRWPVSPPIVYPVGERTRWRAGVDRVMADASGVADDW